MLYFALFTSFILIRKATAGFCTCTTEYSPVCCESSDGTMQDYGNRCSAECDGYTGCDEGECPDDDMHMSSTEATFCACMAIYDPVCCEDDDGTMKEYSSSCKAECEGYDAVDCDTGGCPDDISTTDERPCVCATIYDPVCCKNDDGTTEEYSNTCSAGCDGYDGCAAGVCPDDTETTSASFCVCTEIYDPVCCENDDGTTKEYSSICQAECEGYDARDCEKGECFDFDISTTDSGPCVCITLYDPVCCTNDDGVDVQYSNSCGADCDDCTDYVKGECSDMTTTDIKDQESSTSTPDKESTTSTTSECEDEDDCDGYLCNNGSCLTLCGGIAGFECATGYTCNDDPDDSCDPDEGGSDCSGICECATSGGCDGGGNSG
eukprot:512431_1